MHYQVSRNGQTYGPYTLDDLKRYLASGNVLLTDLAKSEEMPEWIPVSQLLVGSTSADAEAPSFSSPGYASPEEASGRPASGSLADPAYTPAESSAAAASAYPDAPNLHWGLVLLFGALTGTLFMYVWNLIVAVWLKRVQPNASSLIYYIGFGVLTVIQIAVTISVYAAQVMSPGIHTSFNPVGGILWLIAWIVKLIARFSQRASLEEHFNMAEPIGLRLSPVMTFFFGGLYFQYHLNRINGIKQAARYGAPRPY